MVEKEMTTGQLAAELHTSPAALRRFLRWYLPVEERPGSSKGRYRIRGRRINEVKRAWRATHADRAKTA